MYNIDMDTKHPLAGRKQTEEHKKKRLESFLRNGKLKGKPSWNKGMTGQFVKDIKGQRFGRLAVLEYAGIYRSPNGGGRGALWKCLCDCGQVKVIQGCVLRSERVISCGCFNNENARKLGLSNTGKNNGMYGRCGEANPRYNPNLTTEDRADRRNVAETITWGKAVKARDNYTCQVCLKRGGRLHSHHKEPFALNKETRYDVSAGATLCKDCHTVFHKEYGDKCSTNDFELFQETHGLIAAA